MCPLPYRPPYHNLNNPPIAVRTEVVPSMNLANFIESNLSPILAEWDAETDAYRSPVPDLPKSALRADTELTFIAVVGLMRTKQVDGAISGPTVARPGSSAVALRTRAREHASNRLEQGFSLEQLVHEYRAMRASVVRRFIQQSDPDRRTFEEFEYFTNALDEALEQSIAGYLECQQEARDRLLGMLAHDLRNPLGATRNSATYLLRSGGLHAMQTQAVGYIANSTKRMHRLVEDLLDFTRTQLGNGLPVRPVPAHMGSVCREVVDELTIAHPERILRFEEGGPLDGHWDLPRIGQMVSNLATNAIQFGYPDRPVTVTAKGRQDVVLVQVHNHGPVIDPLLQHHLFDPYRRPVPPDLPQHNGSSGLHLGLFIAKHIAAAHGGSIAVDSCAQAGTNFTVRLPRFTAQIAAQLHCDEPAH
jgi:signal transduction histidine kinase